MSTLLPRQKAPPAIDVIGTDKCTGCFGCYNACPYNAIEMKISREGFYIPIINENCTYCGVCQEFCPVISPSLIPDRLREPIIYAGWSNDREVRIKSSSGGIFYELARYVIEEGGSVFGVAWDGANRVKHIKVTRLEDLPLIMGSKYLPSNVGKSYKEVLKEVRSGSLVLFSGTPCQVSALRKFTRRKYSNLITVEVVCHGVPSYVVFDKYLEWLSKKEGKKLSRINFRHKAESWDEFNIQITFEDGSSKNVHHWGDPFFAGYLRNLYLQKACYNCKFNRLPRNADLTLGDFWGIPKKLYNKEGTSVILVNTSIGDIILNNLKKLGRITLHPITSVSTATKKNPRLLGSSLEVPPLRKEIIELTSREGFGSIVRYTRPLGSFKLRARHYLLLLRRLLKGY
ncbi:hypothetical protein OCC_01339 [Thermococcus litoralis DSM 5473]|uniref:4Fe-4S ferredoxin-type domain-containing protein n=1 Tax=Thermococcus litoralis (strain ATCC 51850 / DSM 5473 / JCM 8560 / NS-C) TaxID=523849 RepID=H3ZLJ3_THELN|nr:Coenzyme F420 hydrogenase/dehydrogenase, beta subunit C-terminal domain [Thermococcus litoralis]EHR79131.1 hypothetical protein OCC_01339 [Thermococcus litoralis DSM 5473]MDK2853396.1 hypothetical protein [Thermococcaceae archaeon]